VNVAAPLLEFFKRGEVARDVRMLAAAGVLAPRAHEQIAILILLADDRDAEVRTLALHTIDSIPHEALRAYLARTDVPVGVREFFGDRGVFPAEIPAIAADGPLIDSVPDEPSIDVEVAALLGYVSDDDEPIEGPVAESLIERLQKMGFTQRVKAAMRGSREIRAILIRDPNKIVAAAVLSSPKLSDSEVESYARMTSVTEDVLRTIGLSRAWIKNYGIVVALTRNPKTPIGISLHLMSRLNDRDMTALSHDRNIPDPLRTAARRRVVFGGDR
jgi:hypothetical protein